MLQKVSRWLLVVVLLLALWGSAYGPLDHWINDVALGEVARTNEVYLEESFDNASKLFLILTGIKTVLAIVEGSDVGVGFSLQVGDIVKAVYDYIDFAWMVMLLSTLVLKLTQLLLLTARWADSQLLSITLLVFLVYLLVKWNLRSERLRDLRCMLRDLSYLLVTITLAAYLLLPLSVAAGARMSDEITRIHKQQAEAELIVLSSDLQAKYDSIGEAEGFLNKAGKVKETLFSFGSYLAARTGDLFWHVVSLCAAYIFDTVVFPLGLFALLFWLARLLARYFFGLRQQRTFREDLGGLFDRYLGGSVPGRSGGSPGGGYALPVTGGGGQGAAASSSVPPAPSASEAGASEAQASAPAQTPPKDLPPPQ